MNMQMNKNGVQTVIKISEQEMGFGELGPEKGKCRMCKQGCQGCKGCQGCGGCGGCGGGDGCKCRTGKQNERKH